MITRVYLDISQPEGFYESIIIPSDSDVYYRRRADCFEFEQASLSDGFWKYQPDHDLDPSDTFRPGKALRPYKPEWLRLPSPQAAFNKQFIVVECADDCFRYDNDLLHAIERAARDHLGQGRL